MKYPQARIVVMSKAPVPGQVKTRLAPALGTDGAAAFYQLQVERTLAMLARAALCPATLCCAPDTRHAFFSACAARYPVTLREQGEGDLGARMARALDTALQFSHPVVIVGCDCPGLCADDIERAILALAGDADVVLGPATDGGYYLLATGSPHAALFRSIDWGSDRVLAQTLQRSKEQQLAVHQLTPRGDIDTPADYHDWLNARVTAT